MGRELPYRIEEHGEGFRIEIEGGVVRAVNVALAVAGFGLGQLVGAALPPVAPLAWILGVIFALGMLGDALRPPKLYITPVGVQYTTLWPMVSFTIPWEELQDARLMGTTLNLVRGDGTSRQLWLFTLPEEQRTWVEIEIRRRLGSPVGLDRLPGEKTPDGLVVPLGMDPAAKRGGLAAVMGMITAMTAGLVTALFLGDGAPSPLPVLILVAVVSGLGLLAWRTWTRMPDGLRIGSREIAVMRGTEVVWRRGLHEIAGARVLLTGRIALETVDGERTEVAIGRLAGVQGGAQELVRVLEDLAAEARERPEAKAAPDPRLVALVQRTSER